MRASRASRSSECSRAGSSSIALIAAATRCVSRAFGATALPPRPARPPTTRSSVDHSRSSPRPGSGAAANAWNPATIGSAASEGGRLGASKAKRRAARDRSRGLGSEFLAEAEAHAAVADAVLVGAAEAAAGVAGQQRAGHEIAGAAIASIGELARNHGGNAEAFVPLLERPVLRAGAADEFGKAPAVARRERPRGDQGGVRCQRRSE